MYTMQEIRELFRDFEITTIGKTADLLLNATDLPLATSRDLFLCDIKCIGVWVSIPGLHEIFFANETQIQWLDQFRRRVGELLDDMPSGDSLDDVKYALLWSSVCAAQFRTAQ